MSIPAAILLAVVQGLTEFLPVSSSGHLAIARHFLPGFHEPGVLYEIVLHLGTLGAVLIYFRYELRMLFEGLWPGPDGVAGRRLGALVALGTVPAVIVALAFGDWVEASFDRLIVVGLALCVTGALLLTSSYFRSGTRELTELRVRDALVVGALQSMALVPGISRSGSTIVAGLSQGVAPVAAARFSFLLSIPAILGAAVFNFKDITLVAEEAMLGYVVGFLTSFVVGYFAIGAVVRLMVAKRFHWFGYYCLGMGGVVFVYVYFAIGLA
jgi:undecaprenyl-diphosphatase